MEGIEKSESGRENLSEHQKEILENVGLESAEALKELIEDLEGEKRQDETERQYQERKEQLDYFKEVQAQLYE